MEEAGCLDQTHIISDQRFPWPEVLAAMDMSVWLAPGSEATARAVLEVMATGRPVIAGNLGPIPEIIADGENGRIVEDGVTVDQLAEPPPDLDAWRRQVSAMWLFDYLTANNDRHANNVLASPEYRLVMIDNSRAFAQFATPLRTMTQTGGATRALFWITSFDPDLEHYETSYSPALIERLKSLTNDGLKSALGSFVDKSERRRVLDRRETILRTIADLYPDSGGPR